MPKKPEKTTLPVCKKIIGKQKFKHSEQDLRNCLLAAFDTYPSADEPKALRLLAEDLFYIWKHRQVLLQMERGSKFLNMIDRLLSQLKQDHPQVREHIQAFQAEVQTTRCVEKAALSMIAFIRTQGEKPQGSMESNLLHGGTTLTDGEFRNLKSVLDKYRDQLKLYLFASRDAHFSLSTVRQSENTDGTMFKPSVNGIASQYFEVQAGGYTPELRRLGITQHSDTGFTFTAGNKSLAPHSLPNLSAMLDEVFDAETATKVKNLINAGLDKHDLDLVATLDNVTSAYASSFSLLGRADTAIDDTKAKHGNVLNLVSTTANTLAKVGPAEAVVASMTSSLTAQAHNTAADSALVRSLSKVSEAQLSSYQRMKVLKRNSNHERRDIAKVVANAMKTLADAPAADRPAQLKELYSLVAEKLGTVQEQDAQKGRGKIWGTKRIAKLIHDYIFRRKCSRLQKQLSNIAFMLQDIAEVNKEVKDVLADASQKPSPTLSRKQYAKTMAKLRGKPDLKDFVPPCCGKKTVPTA